MILIFKIFLIFVVRTKSNFHGDITTNKAETNTWGRHTGESPAVISMHRIDLVRSDLPSFINQNSFFMRTKNDDRLVPCQACGQPTKPSIEEILNEFFIWQTAESVQKMLWEWFSLAVGSEIMNTWSAKDRSDLAFLYERLSDFITDLEIIHHKKS